MNRIKYPIYMMFPFLLGMIVDRTVLIPGVGVAVLVLAPFVLLPFWFWLGNRLASENISCTHGLIISNAMPVFLAFIYLIHMPLIQVVPETGTLLYICQLYTEPLAVLSGRLSPVIDLAMDYRQVHYMNLMPFSYFFEVILLISMMSVGFLYGRWVKRRNLDFAKLIGERYAK